MKQLSSTRRIRSLVALFSVLIGMLCVEAAWAQTNPDLITAAAAPIDAPFVPGEIIVGIHRSGGSGGVQAASVDAQLAAVADAQVAATVDLRGLDGAAGDAGVSGFLVAVPPGAEWRAIDTLTAQPGIAFAHPNWMVFAAQAPATQPDLAEGAEGAVMERPFRVNDPLYADELWYLQRVNAARAWSLAESSGQAAQQTIQVAVIDSGIDASHADLEPHLLPGQNYVTPGTDPVDDYGHGTHVAGVIATTLNNGEGQSGLAPWVRIDARKVLNSSGGGSIANVAAAIRDATDDGAHIINLSLEARSPSPTMEAAVNYADGNGVLLIAAAGNCSAFSPSCPPPVQWPAAYDNVMAVAATNYDNQRASYSAVGKEVEIAAPGGEQSSGSDRKQIYSAWSIAAIGRCDPVSGDYQYLDGGSYCNSSGTSMAAGVVSGIAALALSFDPEMDADELRRLLNRTAAPLPYAPDNVGSGLVDAQAALRELIAPDLQPSTTELVYVLSPDTQPFSTTVTLENPSRRAIAWDASLNKREGWLTLVADDGFPTDGLATWGKPANVTLEISPTNLVTGTYRMDLDIVGEWGTGTTVERTVPVNLLIDSSIHTYYFPYMVMDQEGATEPLRTAAFRWEVPNEDGREVRTLTDTSNIGVTLPFTFPLRGQLYTSLRLFSDGYAVFPADNTGSFQKNVCPVENAWPEQAIYGWWADLDPGKAGARVSLFETDEGHYVIEFHDVPAAAGSESAYRVSFQIVLQRNGNFDLNYLTVPVQIGAPPAVTIGAEAVDGRFRNLIFCAADERQFGFFPGPRQTFHFTPEDLY